VGALAGVAGFLAVRQGLLAGGVGLVRSFAVQASLAALLFLVGVWAAARAERAFGTSDDGRIVIDEVAGQWVALLPVAVMPAMPAMSDVSANGPVLFFSVVTGFVLFRAFDIGKPGLVGWAERRFKGGWGVMLDDLIAGGYAAVMLGLLMFAFAQPADSAHLGQASGWRSSVLEQGVAS
jgi:phosphatidylglycerophosphatase A